MERKGGREEENKGGRGKRRSVSKGETDKRVKVKPTHVPVSIKVVDEFSDRKRARHLATLQLVEIRVQKLVARLRPSRYVDNEVPTFITQLT